MKNIFVLPTEQKTRLFTCDSELTLAGYPATTFVTGKHLYITNSEDINENDHIITKDGRLIQVSYLLSKDLQEASKVVICTDPELIKNGVQSIPDDFLEWFVKNSSCEFVEVGKTCLYGECNCYMGICEESQKGYKPIIPQPKQDFSNKHYSPELESIGKQETIEEVAENHINEFYNAYVFKDLLKHLFIAGAKHQPEKMFSESDMLEASKYGYNFHKTTQFPNQEFEDSCIRNTQQWLTQHKKH